MIMTKLRFINSLRNKRERDKNTVETTVIKMIILELRELLVDIKMFLTLTSETKKKMMK